jgi:UDP-glucose 4-epimerase
VKKASGVDFTVKQSPRRPGDPAAVVASSEKIRNQLGWKPEHANLDTIVTQALNWEKHLAAFKLAS